jgi:hypothetical protein
VVRLEYKSKGCWGIDLECYPQNELNQKFVLFNDAFSSTKFIIVAWEDYSK